MLPNKIVNEQRWISGNYSEMGILWRGCYAKSGQQRFTSCNTNATNLLPMLLLLPQSPPAPSTTSNPKP